MQDIKPGDVILVKMKVDSVISTKDEMICRCIPVSPYDNCNRYFGYARYINTEDIMGVINDG